MEDRGAFLIQRKEKENAQRKLSGRSEVLRPIGHFIYRPKTYRTHRMVLGMGLKPRLDKFGNFPTLDMGF